MMWVVVHENVANCVVMIHRRVSTSASVSHFPNALDVSSTSNHISSIDQTPITSKSTIKAKEGVYINEYCHSFTEDRRIL